jgi:hypothetical protein
MSISKNKDWSFDQIDRQIFEEGLEIKSVFFNKDLDIMLILLNNRKVLQRKISMTEKLKSASIDQLHNYEISRTGIHWPDIDEDLSLRGFLKEEILYVLKNTPLSQAD